MLHPDPGIFGISDALLMSAAVYLTALVIKRDQAVRLLSLMLILTSCSLLARLSCFAPLIRTVDILVASAPIILAIIFQSDLRRYLLSLGKPLNQPPPQQGDDGSVDEILRALSEMAARRIGALIVVVRHQPIEHLVQMGTDIDAKVTGELLNSIFLPYSPIHDGAVLIEKGKITRAGCLLPLSHNPDIAKSFGTRHRAALGLSEQCDALILVVSEETGKISTVHDGKIAYDNDPAELRKSLKKALDHKRH